MKIILKILTFTIITVTALVLLIKPELVRTMIPGIVEKIYVAINKIISIEREDDLKPSIIVVAMIMPVFAGIMRFISDFNDDIGGKIMEALLLPLGFIVVIFLFGVSGFSMGVFIIYILFKASPLFVIISYIYCFYIMTKDFEHCNCDCHEPKECCVGECF